MTANPQPDDGQSASDLAKLEFDRLLSGSPDEAFYRMTLFVTGHTAKSILAVATVRTLCESHLSGRYELEVVDIYQSPERLAGDQIVAAPTLFKREPVPQQKLVGNLHDPERVLMALNLGSQTKTDINWAEL
jgi:circadian clock protein KaiB